MAILEFRNIRKSFGAVEVLHGVSFQLDDNHVLGLVGENGSGKSTCMNILGGVHRPTSGQMKLTGKDHAPANPRDAASAGVAFVHQELNLFDNLSIEENIFVGKFPKLLPMVPLIHRSRIRRRTSELLELVDLHQTPSTLASRLSQGERQLVEIAKALNLEARILILDEPTTSLTHRECERLFEIVDRLRGRGISIIYISHILEDVLRMADDVVVLRDGDVVAGGKAAEMTEDDLVRWMVGRQISQLYPDRQSAHHPKPLLQVESVTQPEFVSNISFQVCEGEIFGISGLMGSGRTELARMLFGLETFQSGTIRVAGESIPNPTPQKCMRAGMALVTEDRQDEGLLMTEAIRPNIALASLSDYASTSLRILDRTGLASAADQSAKKAGIVAEDPLRKLVCNLSGGNQQKVVLAKWLMRRPRVLILDEPTRGVDVGAKHEVYRTISELAAAGMAVVMISSELEELIGMCDRIAVMNRGEITAEFQRDEFDSQRIMQAAVWTREEVPT